MNCVSFLVNFGVNLWTLDNEQRSVIDVAALKDNQDIVKYLDSEIAREVSSYNQNFAIGKEEN
jgi:hypothetical protein